MCVCVCECERVCVALRGGAVVEMEMTRLPPGPRGAGRLDGQRMEPTEHGASKARQQQEMIDQTHRDEKKKESGEERERGV